MVRCSRNIYDKHQSLHQWRQQRLRFLPFRKIQKRQQQLTWYGSFRSCLWSKVQLPPLPLLILSVTKVTSVPTLVVLSATMVNHVPTSLPPAVVQAKTATATDPERTSSIPPRSSAQTNSKKHSISTNLPPLFSLVP